jgi:hypothetical protein
MRSMTDETMRECPPEESLCDLLDGGIAGATAESLRAHVASCARCVGFVSRVEALREQAHAMPREIAPPALVWSGIHERIARERPVPDVGHIVGTRGAFWSRAPMLAAAAVILVVLSSSLTVLVMQRGQEASVVERIAPSIVGAGTPATLRAVDESHAGVIDELTRALDEHREQLSPQTVAAVERSLLIIDEALIEAREALAQDPGNTELADLVAATYRQKLTVLRRATEIASRS